MTCHKPMLDTLQQRGVRLTAQRALILEDLFHSAGHRTAENIYQHVRDRLPGLEHRDDRKYYGMVLRPNCFLSLLPDHVIVHRFEPVSAEVTTVVCEWLFPPSTVAGYDLDDTVEFFHKVNEQDFAASEWCQPNMKSRAYAGGGVLVPSEQEIIGRWYYRWYRESMEEAGQALDGLGIGATSKSEGGEQVLVELHPHDVAGVAVGGVHPRALPDLGLAQRRGEAPGVAAEALQAPGELVA